MADNALTQAKKLIEDARTLVVNYKDDETTGDEEETLDECLSSLDDALEKIEELT